MISSYAFLVLSSKSLAVSYSELAEAAVSSHSYMRFLALSTSAFSLFNRSYFLSIEVFISIIRESRLHAASFSSISSLVCARFLESCSLTSFNTLLFFSASIIAASLSAIFNLIASASDASIFPDAALYTSANV